MRDWPHAPLHRLEERGAYMVTAGTYRKQPFFSSAEQLDGLHDTLLAMAPQYGWRIQAWAVFPNHYHFVAMAPEDPRTLRQLIRHLHSDTARRLNAAAGASGRRVWFNFWETHLTYERSYLSRLRYVHENAVHHGVARCAVDYRWCSARWFEASAPPAFRQTVAGFKTYSLHVRDDFPVGAVE
jgi:putative transposase